MNSALLHYSSIAIVLILPVFGLSTGIYQAIIGQWKGRAEQPAVASNIMTFFWFGVLFIEASFMIAVVIALIIAGSRPYASITLPMAIGELAFAISISLCICATSIASGAIFGAGCRTIARQPFISSKIVQTTMTFIAFVEMTFFLGLILGLIIWTKLSENLSLIESVGMLGGSLCIGLGSIGPTLGLRKFGASSLESIAQNRLITPILGRFCGIIIFFIDMVLIFSFICALLMIYRPLTLTPTISLIVLTSLSCAVGLVSFGVTKALASIGSKVIKTLAKDQANYTSMSTFSAISACFIESALLFSMLMIFGLIFYIS